MSEALEKVISDADKMLFALTLVEAPGKLEEAAEQMSLSTVEVAALLNDPGFLKLVRGVTRARASLAFHGVVIEKLTDIAQNGADADALAAARIIGQITGDLRSHHSVDVKVTFDDLRKRGADASDPLNGLFDIKGEVIEAEPIDTDAAAEEAEYTQWETEQ